MELEVWDSLEARQKVRLRLRKVGGEVVLEAVTAAGNVQSLILSVLPTGRIRFYQNVDPKLGFDLHHADGQVKTTI